MKRIAQLPLFLLLAYSADSQIDHFSCPEPNSPMTSYCEQACVICDLDGYTSINALTNLGEIPDDFCGVQHNTQWLAFMTATSNISFEIAVSDCQMGDGVQIGLYASNDCEDFLLISNCENQIMENAADTITANGLFTGYIYYLVMDGAFGDICSFTINVLEGDISGPDITGAPVILGNFGQCTGITARYYVVLPAGTVDMDWTLNGDLIGHNLFVDIEFPDPGSYELCFTPANPCFGEGPTTCETIEVLTIPPLEDYVRRCSDDFPFLYRDQSIPGPGVYTLETYNEDNCFQIVELVVEEEINVPILQPIQHCFNSPLLFGGEVITTPGIYFVPLTSTNGCDSTVILNVQGVDAYNITTSANICEGEQYLFDNQILTEDGTYTANLLSGSGCDSTVTLTLNVELPDTTYLATEFCQGDTLWQDGEAITSAGTYSFIYPTLGACDSTLLVDVVELPVYEVMLNAQICSDSFFIFQNDTLRQEGTYLFEGSSEMGCDSMVQLELLVFPTDKMCLDTSICEGTAIAFEGALFSESGTYDFFYHTAQGCDSSLTLNLDIIPIDTIIQTASICLGEIYIFDNQTLETSGTYYFTFSNIGSGCDSIVQIDLQVLPESATSFSATICEGETFAFGGSQLTQNGTYFDTLSNQLGCDSVAQLSLNVLQNTQSSFSATICEGESYNFSGSLLTQNGNYLDTLSNQFGCDSVVQLSLNVLQHTQSSLDATICEGDSYVFGGSLLTQNGNYLDTLSNQLGCDSVVQLSLNVLQNTQSSFSATICEGETYAFGGSLLTQNGTYLDTLSNQLGCDSVVQLSLNVLQNTQSSFSATICEGNSYAFGGSQLAQNGTYLDTLVNQFGCDSVVQLSLNVQSQSSDTISAFICEGETFDFGGSLLNQAGTYQNTLLNQFGCDSLVMLELIVHQPFEESIEASICEGQSFALNSIVYESAGSYVQSFVDSFGCDSIYLLDLNVLDTNLIFLQDTICEGEAIMFESQFADSTGTYVEVLTNSQGCDSTRILQLWESPAPDISLDFTICEGQSIFINGQEFAESGQYMSSLPSNGQGCDTVVTLTLNVLPNPVTFLHLKLCEGDTLEVANTLLSQPGNYVFDLESATGCDSTILLDLTVQQVYDTPLVVELCEGDTILFEGQPYWQTGTYIDTIPRTDSCNRIAALELTVFSSFYQRVDTSFCEGDSFVFGNIIYQEGGQFIWQGQTAQGCDSLVELNLEVLDCELRYAFTQTDPLCAGANSGSIQIIDWNGVFPLLLEWSVDGMPQSQTIITASDILELTNLVAGVYDFTLSDENGQAQIFIIELSDPAPLLLDFGISSYGDYQLSCVQATDGWIFPEISGGTPPYSFFWSTGQLSPELEQLSAGLYSLTVSDANGCMVSGSWMLEAPSGLSLHYDLSQPNCLREMGLLENIQIAGGTPPYQILLDGANVSNSNRTLAPGTYLLQVLDDQLCQWETTLEVEVVEVYNLSIGNNQELQLGETTSLPIQANFIYDSLLLTIYPPEACPACTWDAIKPLFTANYQLIAIDSLGCQEQASITIFVVKPRDIFIPNAFSPNNDGFNDRLTVFAGKDVVEVRSFHIFDRWGNQVFQRQDFPPNDPNLGWDGQVRGQAAAPGVYVYFAVVEFIDGTEVIMKGEVALLR